MTELVQNMSSSQLEYLDKAVDKATMAISVVEDDQGDNLRLRLFSLAEQIIEKLEAFNNLAN